MKERKTVIKFFFGFLQKFLDIGIFIFVFLYLFTIIYYKDSLVKILGYEFNIVQSNSMRGTLERYDFVIVTSADTQKIKVGDIVVFFDTTDKYKIIHRVTKIYNINGNLFFQTKGDNNEFKDTTLKAESDIYAKYSLKIPLVGVIITFFSSTYGLMVIFLNIWNLVFISLLWKLDNEVKLNFNTDYKILKQSWKKNKVKIKNKMH